jgi:hypothetical protein
MDENQIKELADAIYVEKIRRARAMKPTRKMGTGAELFAEVCGRMKAGIRAQFPIADETEVSDLLRRRLDRLEAVEDSGVFKKLANR